MIIYNLFELTKEKIPLKSTNPRPIIYVFGKIGAYRIREKLA